MLVKFMQPLNAESPILVTLFGISILVKPVHPLNAKAPIILTLSDIFKLVKLVHPLNAKDSIWNYSYRSIAQFVCTF